MGQILAAPVAKDFPVFAGVAGTILRMSCLEMTVY
jgi:hypothetical protein